MPVRIIWDHRAEVWPRFAGSGAARAGVDGRYRRFLSRAVPLYDAQGQLLQWFGTYAEIEARQQADDALHEAQAALAHVARLTMLGELTASIAHEVNRPLGAVVTQFEIDAHVWTVKPPAAA